MGFPLFPSLFFGDWELINASVNHGQIFGFVTASTIEVDAGGFSCRFIVTENRDGLTNSIDIMAGISSNKAGLLGVAQLLSESVACGFIDRSIEAQIS